MLGRLRAQFIALTMVTVGIMLTLVSVAICFGDYQRSLADVHQVLENAVSPIHVAENDGVGPDSTTDEPSPNSVNAQEKGTDEAADVPDSAARAESDAADAPNDAATALEDTESTESDSPHPIIGGAERGGTRVIPIAVYSVDEDGATKAVVSRATASIDADVLEAAISDVLSSPDGHGDMPSVGLYYAKRTYDIDGESIARIAFADQSSVSSWQKLAVLCAIVEVVALGVLLVISWLLSKWALRPAERAWAQQKQFVADASHELKTPLTVILANTSILMRHTDDTVGSQRQWIESTQTEAERMQTLVGDMLELASLDKPKASPRDERLNAPRVDFADLVEGELLQFESIAYERAIIIESTIAADIFVRGDATQLERMVSTLLENAYKYSDEGGTVSVTLSAVGDSVRLELHNRGVVIPADDLPHVFDRFFRADKARTRDGGYGLGLSIAQDIARSHGGAIAAKSSEDAGTTFTVTIPRG